MRANPSESDAAAEPAESQAPVTDPEALITYGAMLDLAERIFLPLVARQIANPMTGSNRDYCDAAKHAISAAAQFFQVWEELTFEEPERKPKRARKPKVGVKP